MAMSVGGKAQRARRRGDTPEENHGPKMAKPAGLGAFAMTVNPPPASAPETTAYLNASAWAPGTEKAGTWDAR